jgi:hypothetical protein
VKKLGLFRTPSNGAEGYEALNGEVSDEVIFAREKITSVSRVLSRNSSFTSPRTMSLIPAKHRIVHNDSSGDDDDEEEEGLSGATSPVSESDLDFGSRNRVCQVSDNTLPARAVCCVQL